MLRTIILILSIIGFITSLSAVTTYLVLLHTPRPTVKFYTDSKHPYLHIKLPTRATTGSAGYDIYLPRNLTFPAKSVVMVDTGVKVKIPEGFVMNLYPRSSIGIKKQLMLANTVGIIDSDFNDTIKLAIYNYSNNTVTLNAGERIAQAVTTCYITTGEKVNTTRQGGLGSTGR